MRWLSLASEAELPFSMPAAKVSISTVQTAAGHAANRLVQLLLCVEGREVQWESSRLLAS